MSTEPVFVAKVINEEVNFSKLSIGELFYHSREFWVKVDNQTGKQVDPNRTQDLGNQRLSRMMVQKVKQDYSLELSW